MFKKIPCRICGKDCGYSKPQPKANVCSKCRNKGKNK